MTYRTTPKYVYWICLALRFQVIHKNLDYHRKSISLKHVNETEVLEFNEDPEQWCLCGNRKMRIIGGTRDGLSLYFPHCLVKQEILNHGNKKRNWKHIIAGTPHKMLLFSDFWREHGYWTDTKCHASLMSSAVTDTSANEMISGHKYINALNI